jgi:hypothetical protein
MSLTNDEDDDSVQPTEAVDVELGDEPGESDEVVMNADGSADVVMGEERSPLDSEHYQNLAELLEEHELTGLGLELCELVEEDLESRKGRDEMYALGIQRAGVGEDAPGGADFQGASKVSHPLLLEACIDFQARAIKELFPPDGPAKDKIIGRISKEKVEKARRKVDYMNWQLTSQVPGFLTILEQFLIQLPMGGSQYLKGPLRDERMKRPYFKFVPIDDVILPYAANDYSTAQRRTERLWYTDLDVERLMEEGTWRTVDLGYAPQIVEKSASKEAQDAVEGKTEDTENRDGLRPFYEVDALLDLGLPESDGVGPLPYLVTIDVESHTVLSIYRNWDEGDEKLERIDRMNGSPFIPWEGPYGLGFPQMIGGLTAAATGALRALLDSAHIANAPTALKLKSAIGGQSPPVRIGQVTEIEGSPAAIDPDIRKIAMPLPFPGPNAVLFQLLGFLVDAGRGVVRTALEETQDGPNTPVGTTLARIQEGMVVFSAIHRRLHDFMGRVLKGLHRYNAIYLNEREVVEEAGDLEIKRSDFKGPLDVIPVSDPNIFSDLQRTSQMQLVQQRAVQLAPLGIYDLRKVEERFLEQAKIPAYKELLLPRPEPMELNAVNENMAAMMGRPIVAFPEQDHLAHLQTHLEFLQAPLFGSNPLVAPKASPALIQHVMEHLGFWYTTTVYESANKAAAQTGIEDVAEVLRSKDPKEKQALDRLLATINTSVLTESATLFEKIPPIIQQVMQFMQSMQPPQPVDPTIVAMKDVERRGAQDQAQNQLKQAELQQRGQAQQTDAQLKAQKLQADQAKDAKAAEEKAAQQAADNAREAERQAAEERRLEREQAAEDRRQMQELRVKLAESERDRAIERERLMTESAARERELRADVEKARLAADVKLTTNREDNATALELAELGNKQVSTGTGTGPNPQP